MRTRSKHNANKAKAAFRDTKGHEIKGLIFRFSNGDSKELPIDMGGANAQAQRSMRIAHQRKMESSRTNQRMSIGRLLQRVLDGCHQSSDRTLDHNSNYLRSM